MISMLGQIHTASYASLPEVSSGGRTHILVRPSQFIYSQFQHVSGVPARDEQHGVSVDKIRILNSLIDNLIQLKQKNVDPDSKRTTELTGDQIDTLITQYQEQIRTAASMAEQMLYKPMMPETGAVINLVA